MCVMGGGTDGGRDKVDSKHWKIAGSSTFTVDAEWR